MSTTDTATLRKYWELEPHDHPEGASTSLGFWVYLMSDCLMFAVLFAVYGVLGNNFAAGPGPKDLFDLELVAVNTTMLLLSSITFGFAMLAMGKGDQKGTLRWLAVTLFFGLCFLSIELYEFSHMIHLGAGPQRLDLGVQGAGAGGFGKLRQLLDLRFEVGDRALELEIVCGHTRNLLCVPFAEGGN